MPVSDTQLSAVEELLRRGKLTGRREAAARELLRRHGRGEQQSAPQADDEIIRRSREGGKSARAAKIAEMADSGTGAFMHSFANAATLGLADRAVDLMNAGARAIGLPALSSEETEQVNEQVAVNHPYADLAGGVAGTVAGGAAAGGAAAKLGIRPARTLVRRGLQYAAGGAAAGATEQAIREGKLNGDTLAAAAVGGVTGAVGGTAAEKVLPLVAARSSRAWRKLAAKMKTSVDDLEAYIADTQRATGVAPSIAQVFHARDQGLLQGWAARHNTFGTKMNEAAAAAPAQDLSAGRLRKVRSDDIEKALDSPRRSGGAPNAPTASTPPPTVRESPVKISQSLLEEPSFHDALRGPRMRDIRIKIGNGDPITVGDVDRIRQKLRALQKQEPGGPFGDLGDQLRDEAAQQVPEYGAALDRYSRQSRFIEGFEEGKAGRSLPEVSDKIETVEGKAGHKAGELTRRGQQNLRRMAPSTPIDEGELPNVTAFGRGAAHMATGGHALGIFHTIRGMMDMLPESYQQELAKGLLTRDPAAITATLAKLRQAGADLQDIRRLAGGMATLLGGDASAAAGSDR